MISKKKILITGGGGFLGLHLSNYLLSFNNKIILFDIIFPKNLLKTKNKNLKIIKGNLLKEDILKKVSKGCDYIFHFGGIVGQENFSKNNIRAINTEIIGLKNVCLAAKLNKVKKIIYNSTSGIYDLKEEYTQDLENINPYSYVKKFGEIYLSNFSKQYKVDILCLRVFNVYGPYQNKSMVIQKFLSLAIQDKPILIYSKGKQKRDFIYVDDYVRQAVHKVMKYKGSHTFDVLSGNKISILKLANLIKKIANSNSEVKLVKIKSNFTNFYIHEIKNSLRLNKRPIKPKPIVKLEKGLRLTLESFVEKKF